MCMCILHIFDMVFRILFYWLLSLLLLLLSGMSFSPFFWFGLYKYIYIFNLALCTHRVYMSSSDIVIGCWFQFQTWRPRLKFRGKQRILKNSNQYNNNWLVTWSVNFVCFFFFVSQCVQHFHLAILMARTHTTHTVPIGNFWVISFYDIFTVCCMR